LALACLVTTKCWSSDSSFERVVTVHGAGKFSLTQRASEVNALNATQTIGSHFIVLFCHLWGIQYVCCICKFCA